MIIKETTTDLITPCPWFSWTPIFAGALTTVGLYFLLNIFNVAIGISAFTTNQSEESVLIGGLLGVCLGSVAVSFTGGWFAGYLGRYCSRAPLGALYGFLAWSLSVILTVFFASFIAKYISFYTAFISTPSYASVTSPSNMGLNLNAHFPNAESHLHLVSISTFIIFCIFFLSAFASCIGGHVGMLHDARKLKASKDKIPY